MDNLAQSLEYVKSLAGDFVPEVGIVLGSGLAAVADSVSVVKAIPFSQIPGFAQTTCIGHKGELILARMAGRNVCIAKGRIHYYESCDMGQVIAPVRLMGMLGVRCLFVTNASGGVNISYRNGDIMVISDHINMQPNPLAGLPADALPDRFVDMANAYDQGLLSLCDSVARKKGIKLHYGVYLGVCGPSYETAAENRFFRIIGADAVGMSTTPEVIVARQMGMRVFGLSVVTSQARDAAPGASTNGEEVLVAAQAACAKVQALFEGMIKNL